MKTTPAINQSKAKIFLQDALKKNNNKIHISGYA